MTIDYTDILNVTFDGLSGTEQAQAISALQAIGQTNEGQTLFGLIENNEDSVDLVFSATGSSNYNPITKTLTLSYGQLASQGFYGADGALHNFTIQRALAHELFHIADNELFLSDEINEARAIQFENEFMAKYYGDDSRRITHGIGSLSEEDLAGASLFNENFNPAGHAGYVFIGKAGEGLEDLLTDIGSDEFQNNATNYFYKVIAAYNEFSSDLITTDYMKATDGPLGFSRISDAGEYDSDDSLSTSDAKAVYSFRGNDTISVEGGARIVFAGSGDDSVLAGTGYDNILNGGHGSDVISYDGFTAGIVVNLASNEATTASGAIHKDSLVGFENIIGSSFDDTLTGDSLDNKIEGGNGNDQIAGGIGSDRLEGGAGNDTYVFSYGETGVDEITDGDVLGQVQINGLGLTGIAVINSSSPLSWTMGHYTLTRSGTGGADLTFTSGFAGDPSFVIRNFTNGDLGITLSQPESSAAGPNDDLIQNASGIVAGGAGNDTISSSPNVYASMQFFGEDGNDSIFSGSRGFATTIDGGAGSDTLFASDGNTTVIGGDGDDLLSASAGWSPYIGSYLSGGDGNDTLVSALDWGIDTLVGGGGFDTYVTRGSIDVSSESEGSRVYTDAASTITGGSGNDIFYGSSAADTLIGAASADLLSGGAGADSISGDAGRDAIFGDAGNDTIVGGNDHDSIAGGADNDSILGEDGDDIVQGDGGNDYISGGLGADLVSGGNDNDSLWGGGGADLLSGDAGNDSLIGEDGADTLNGGNGLDSIYGGLLADSIDGGAGDDYIEGGDGDDMIVGGAGSDYIDGGAGIDTVSYAASSAWVNVDLANNNHWNGDAAWDNIASVENVIGSAFSDALTGNSGVNVLTGGNGNDTLTGLAGNDTLYGGAGDDSILGGDNNDLILGGAGSDYIDGGAGTDTVSYADSTAWVNVNLSTNSHWNGDAAWDNIVNVENIIGSDHNDALTGTTLANALTGGLGNDTLSGLGGNDTLLGGDGNDSLLGGDGGDQLHGGYGNNYLDGGAGSDQLSYAFAGAGINLNLVTNTVTGTNINDTLAAGTFEFFYDTAYADTIVGGSAAEVFNFSGGNDSFDGGGGNDNAVINAYAGYTLEGGSGTDTLGFNTALGAFNYDMQTGVLSYSGGAMQATGFERILGTNGHDTMTGASTDDYFSGGLGNDVLSGNGGNDTLFGATGDDTLTGGSGDDLFSFVGNHGLDVINDFQGVGAATGDIIRILGSSYGALAFSQNGSDAVITHANGTITLVGVNSASLTADDFTFA